VPDDAVHLLGYRDVRFRVSRQAVNARLALPASVDDLADELVCAVERQARPALAQLKGFLVPLLGLGRVAEPQVLPHACVLLAHGFAGVVESFERLAVGVLGHGL
jgi:hypothetical protein